MTFIKTLHTVTYNNLLIALFRNLLRGQKAKLRQKPKRLEPQNPKNRNLLRKLTLLLNPLTEKRQEQRL